MSRVLLVDDDTVSLDVRRIILERAGHEVFTSSDPGRARALFSETLPEVVVLDLRLPTAAAGRALIREFRETAPGVRIIVLAGWPPDLDDTPEAAMVDRVLMKPIRTTSLLEALETCRLKEEGSV